MSEVLTSQTFDRKRFPLLHASAEQPCSTLIGCDDLVFMAPKDATISYAVMRKAGRDWHLYGDTRWPATAVWVEFPFDSEGFDGFCGILVLRTEIPIAEVDGFGWAAKNCPLLQIMPSARGEDSIQIRAELLRNQSEVANDDADLIDQTPRHEQCYCIFHQQKQGEARLVANYTDLLNSDGLPLTKYRITSADYADIPLCRFALHSLFRLNEARLSGMEFHSINQLMKFQPAFLQPEQAAPKWAIFHPSRTLRTRPSLRSLTLSNEFIEGCIPMEDYQRIADMRRREANSHMLAFDVSARPHDLAAHQNDSNVSMCAFLHRAKGGAIYILPDRLVEEFDKTDCGEVLIGDITLPFSDIFLKFNPPQPVYLANEALVDGCYVVKQMNEYFLMLTSHLEGVDYQNSISLTCIDPTFSLHLPSNDPTMSINSAVENGINEFLAANAPPEENLTETIENPDGTFRTMVDVRAQSRKRRIDIFQSQEPVFRSCLNIIINAACFVAFRPEDIEEAWEGEPPKELIEAINNAATSRRCRDRKRDAVQKIENGDYTRIRICGKNLFKEPHAPGESESGKHPRTHWRRGHWRRQRHGVGLSLVVLRWIRPTLVSKDNGSLVEARLYDIQNPAED